jgi:hypothetical protein
MSCYQILGDDFSEAVLAIMARAVNYYLCNLQFEIQKKMIGSEQGIATLVEDFMNQVARHWRDLDEQMPIFPELHSIHKDTRMNFLLDVGNNM